MPVRGFGQKKVVFGGIRSPPWAVRAIWLTVAGRHRTAAFASPVLTRTGLGEVVLVSQIVRGQARRAASMRLESRS